MDSLGSQIPEGQTDQSAQEKVLVSSSLLLTAIQSSDPGLFGMGGVNKEVAGQDECPLKSLVYGEATTAGRHSRFVCLR